MTDSILTEFGRSCVREWARKHKYTFRSILLPKHHRAPDIYGNNMGAVIHQKFQYLDRPKDDPKTLEPKKCSGMVLLDSLKCYYGSVSFTVIGRTGGFTVGASELGGWQYYTSAKEFDHMAYDCHVQVGRWMCSVCCKNCDLYA